MYWKVMYWKVMYWKVVYWSVVANACTFLDNDVVSLDPLGLV